MEKKRQYKVRVYATGGNTHAELLFSKSVSEEILTGDFVARLYLEAPSWNYFEIFNSVNDAFLCRIDNNRYLSKIRRLTPFNLRLKCSRKREENTRQLRTKLVKACYNQSEYEQLIQNLKNKNIGSISEYIREISLNPRRRFLSEDEARDIKETARLLANIAGNINQIAAKMNTYRMQPVEDPYLSEVIFRAETTLAELKELLSKIRFPRDC